MLLTVILCHFDHKKKEEVEKTEELQVDKETEIE